MSVSSLNGCSSHWQISLINKKSNSQSITRENLPKMMNDTPLLINKVVADNVSPYSLP